MFRRRRGIERCKGLMRLMARQAVSLKRKRCCSLKRIASWAAMMERTMQSLQELVGQMKLTVRSQQLLDVS